MNVRAASSSLTALAGTLLVGVVLASCRAASGDVTDAVTDADGPAGAAVDAGRAARPDAAFTDAREGAGDPSFTACASLTARAERVPLELVVALDSSGSMADVASAGTTKWSAVTRALAAALSDARSTGITASLQFFPIPVPGVPATCRYASECGAYGPCTRRACLAPGPMTYCDFDDDCIGGPCVDLGMCADGSALCVPGQAGGCASAAPCELVTAGECLAADSCDASRYAAVSVPPTNLPSGAASLAAAMSARALRGETPTGPALSGAITLALARRKATGGREAAVLMVTDGLPTGCSPQSTSGLAALAANGVASSVPTFVLGVFAPSEAATAHGALDAIAAAGGTGTASIVGTTPSVGADLATALDRVRTAALGCRYDLPRPDAGTVDPDAVNVSISMHGAKARTAHRVPHASACDGGDEWTYEGGGTEPLRIALCPAACDAVGKDPSAEVSIVLGCATVLK